MVRIINQPIALRMGDIINDSLANGDSFDNFNFIVAFAKKSGISRIQEAMQAFRENGGNIKGVVGIDSKGTSIQGLRLLLQLTNELYVYHDENPSRSFHPKIYIFEKEGVRANAYIGSSNLTSGGLFTNYEIDVELDFDLENPDDLQLFGEIKELFESYTDIDNDCCKRLDELLLSQLIERNLLEDEETQPVAPIDRREQARTEEVDSLFGTGSFRAAPPPYREPIVNIPEEALPESEVETPETIENILVREVPFAKGRTSQVHFTRSIVENYFGLALGGSRHLRFRQFLSGRLKPIEERPLVYSKRNRNPKIELAGAKVLSHAYPSDGSRPILVFEEVGEGLFYYMLLLPRDDGFSELTSYLAKVPQHGQALKYDTIDLRTMRRIWSGYSIGTATS